MDFTESDCIPDGLTQAGIEEHLIDEVVPTLEMEMKWIKKQIKQVMPSASDPKSLVKSMLSKRAEMRAASNEV